MTLVIDEGRKACESTGQVLSSGPVAVEQAYVAGEHIAPLRRLHLVQDGRHPQGPIADQARAIDRLDVGIGIDDGEASRERRG